MGLAAGLLAEGWVRKWGPARLVVAGRRLLWRQAAAVQEKMEGEARTEVGARAEVCLEGSALAELGAPGAAEKVVQGVRVAALPKVAAEMAKQLPS